MGKVRTASVPNDVRIQFTYLFALVPMGVTAYSGIGFPVHDDAHETHQI